MKKFNLSIFAVMLIAALTVTNLSAQQQFALPCKASDPTGTSLNARSKPNGGKIIKKLKNGTTVFIWKENGDAQDCG